jgi:hypothetical protein
VVDIRLSASRGTSGGFATTLRMSARFGCRDRRGGLIDSSARRLLPVPRSRTIMVRWEAALVGEGTAWAEPGRRRHHLGLATPEAESRRPGQAGHRAVRRRTPVRNADDGDAASIPWRRCDIPVAASLSACRRWMILPLQIGRSSRTYDQQGACGTRGTSAYSKVIFHRRLRKKIFCVIAHAPPAWWTSDARSAVLHGSFIGCLDVGDGIAGALVGTDEAVLPVGYRAPTPGRYRRRACGLRRLPRG